ncbi:MAG: serine/threonine protein phosphatase, partial [Rhodospirillales bacterium]|nr:serine/threonine protein phosphatase [Rhodospirillales bacterium]
TIYSYGVRVSDTLTADARLKRMQEQLAEAVPAAHTAFLRQLKLIHQAGDYLFVHAGIDPGKPLAEQTEEDFLWIRDAFLQSDDHLGRIVVHGHSISREPDVRCNRIGIDTGAYVSSHLTCLVLEGGTKRFLHSSAVDASHH